jgi:hypothetical protein
MPMGLKVLRACGRVRIDRYVRCLSDPGEVALSVAQA